MNSNIANRIKTQFNVTSASANSDSHYIVIPAAFTIEEYLEIFNEMTHEVFEKYANLLTATTLMVHLFPPEVIAVKEGNYLLDKKHEGHSRFHILDTIKLDTGELKKCQIEFLEYNNVYDFYYFKHNNWKLFGDKIKERLQSLGIDPVNEWVINYMTNNAFMGKHTDSIWPHMRYTVSIKQPITDCSIRVGNVDHFIPEGTTYIMDGEIPHEIVHRSVDPRITLIGAVKFL